VTAPFRPAAGLTLLILSAVFVAAACGSPTTPTVRPSASTPAPSLTAVPGGPSQGPSRTPFLPSQTDTEFGRIWDALPPSFPIPAGAIVTDARDPVSGSFALGMDAASATATIADALRAQGWSVDVGSPLEDGSVVIDGGGATEGCAMEVRLTPLSGTVSMSVLYGAACPFG
jgi:hypothetical protein